MLRDARQTTKSQHTLRNGTQWNRTISRRERKRPVSGYGLPTADSICSHHIDRTMGPASGSPQSQGFAICKARWWVCCPDSHPRFFSVWEKGGWLPCLWVDVITVKTFDKHRTLAMSPIYLPITTVYSCHSLGINSTYTPFGFLSLDVLSCCN